MNYDEFKLFVKENVGAYFDTEDQVKDIVIKEIHKNGISLDGLLVTPANVNVSPVIYLNNYYVKNMSENEAMEVIKNIAKFIKQSMPEQSFETGWITDFEAVRDKIFSKMIPVVGNESLLENRIYSKKADLAVIYSIYVDAYSSESELASIPINRDLAEKLGVTADILERLVKQNMENATQSMIQPCFRDMADVIPAKFQNPLINMERDQMYVISNIRGLYGATSVLNDQFMDRVKDQIGEDFYLLPSSVHEMICVKEAFAPDVEDLEAMIKEINNSTVSPEERLSDHAYKYDYAAHEIYRADQEQMRLEEQIANQSMRPRISR